MWQYAGLEDPTRCLPDKFMKDDLLARVQRVTKCTSIEEASLVRPYAEDHSLPQVRVLGLLLV